VTFETIRRSAAAEEAVRQIQRRVQRGELRPGEKLPPERELARRLGVSRSTLREALRALVLMNIIVSRHGDGTYVSSLDPELLGAPFQFGLAPDDESLAHLFEARKAVEPACAALAAGRISEAELERLRGILADSEAALDDPEVLFDRDVELHSTIVRASGNPVLIRLMGGLGSIAVASRRRTVRLPGMAESSLADHRLIVAALERRSAAAAAAAMTAHLEHVEGLLRRAGAADAGGPRA
jgi:GntR family transcriptional regulator, transcriptional repressor for pyruvate dehydrogenase complex